MSKDQVFAGSYKIRVGDINYGGHMGNDKALLLFHDARIYFLEERGFSEGNIGGPGIIMGEAHVYYKKEVFRDDELRVFIHIEDIRGISFEMHYSVVRGADEVIKGSTKLIAFDYDLKKVVKIPEVLLEKL